MNFYKLLFSIILIISSIAKAEAQGFSTNLLVGINASQMDGDNLSGFDKLGLQTGIGIEYSLDKNAISIELLYNQKGSAQKSNSNNTLRASTTLNYAQIPILYQLNSWMHQDGYYQMTVEIGPSLSRLINIESTDPAISSSAPNFKKLDIGLVLGINYRVKKQLSIGIRYDQSLTTLYEIPNSTESGLINYLASMRIKYHF